MSRYGEVQQHAPMIPDNPKMYIHIGAPRLNLHEMG